MSQSEDGLTAQLRAFAERWLQRPLTEDEVRELEGFGRSLAMRRSVTQPHTQAAQAVREGRQRARAAIEGVLHSAQQAANAREQEDRAILKMVESAGSLAELRPSSLPSAQDEGVGAARIFVAQIADRLANLIRAEVKACFERQFGPDPRRPHTAPDAAADASQHSTGASDP